VTDLKQILKFHGHGSKSNKRILPVLADCWTEFTATSLATLLRENVGRVQRVLRVLAFHGFVTRRMGEHSTFSGNNRAIWLYMVVDARRGELRDWREKA
jgi:predicted transcriptional regulator